MTEKLLVTGASGLIGSHFIDLVSKDPKYSVKAFEGDLRDKDNVVRNLRDVDTVVHFAAITFVPPSWENPRTYMDVNYGGTVNLLECRRYFSRFVYMSTSHVFGDSFRKPLGPTSLHLPNDPYSISKMAAHRAVEAYSQSFGFDSLVIQPFNNFGPRQSKNFVMPTMILQALMDGKIVIHGDTEKEMIFVKDNVRAIKALIDKRTRGTVAVCKGESYRISWLAEEICHAVGIRKKVEVRESNRPMDIKKLLGDPSSLMAELPWFTFTPMRKAIEETVEYYRGTP